MILKFDKYGNLISSDTSDDLIQDSVNANTLIATFEGVTLSEYIPFINFERSDGELSPSVPVAISDNSIIYTFSDSWVTAKDGVLKCSISLKQNGVVKKTANFHLNVIKSITGLEVHYITDVVYNELLTRLARNEDNINRLKTKEDDIWNIYDIGSIRTSPEEAENPELNSFTVSAQGLYLFRYNNLLYLMTYDVYNSSQNILLLNNYFNNKICYIKRTEDPVSKKFSVETKYIATSDDINPINTSLEILNAKAKKYYTLGTITDITNVNNEVLNTITENGIYTFEYNGITCLMMVSNNGQKQEIYYTQDAVNSFLIVRNKYSYGWSVQEVKLPSRFEITNINTSLESINNQIKNIKNLGEVNPEQFVANKLDNIKENGIYTFYYGSISYLMIVSSDYTLKNVLQTILYNENNELKVMERKCVNGIWDALIYVKTLAYTSYVDKKFNQILGEGATETLDTIGEIAKALNNNANILSTLSSKEYVQTEISNAITKVLNEEV